MQEGKGGGEGEVKEEVETEVVSTAKPSSHLHLHRARSSSSSSTTTTTNSSLYSVDVDTDPQTSQLKTYRRTNSKWIAQNFNVNGDVDEGIESPPSLASFSVNTKRKRGGKRGGKESGGMGEEEEEAEVVADSINPYSVKGKVAPISRITKNPSNPKLFITRKSRITRKAYNCKKNNLTHIITPSIL